MRTFFAVDGASTVTPRSIRDRLSLHISQLRYEILPLEAERFCCARNNLRELSYHAHMEGKKVLGHYPDARLCIVVFRSDVTCRGDNSVGAFDHVLAVPREGKPRQRMLNPPVPEETNLYWASSPGLQPEFLEQILEIAELK